MIAIITSLDPKTLPPPLNVVSYTPFLVGLLAIVLYIRWRRRSSK